MRTIERRKSNRVLSRRSACLTTAIEPLVAMAFKTVFEKFGQLTFVRIYQGRIRKGDTLRNVRTGRKCGSAGWLASTRVSGKIMPEAFAGDIVGVSGIDCASGDTFVGDGISCSLESMFVPEPVMQLSIAPAEPRRR